MKEKDDFNWDRKNGRILLSFPESGGFSNNF